ncbi:MAG TPA: ice-binding family protein, partial [Gammaproteobacteria bacterium]|nr:ice-binding family protein [Gammaproteobacteria bacterium]
DSSIVNNGDLTLGGGATAVYIFIARSSLTMGNGSRVIFSNDGTKASNVFWLVGSSASIGQGAIFKGTIVANNDINFGSGATVSGRALTETGAINLVNNTITLPVNS